ncbi:Hypothetical protein, putative [Bodo saltans]|uniref:Uncharacterized protein n=1 Tax=Bodo saltans TaxID=75058 RepID=A0A0S4KNY4_BODSA|nr:Hypothetical protein, putative [Bodo saltans]|eukprot:CUI14605.1 Hypothetical protein, putative [Bodo saltans]
MFRNEGSGSVLFGPRHSDQAPSCTGLTLQFTRDDVDELSPVNKGQGDLRSSAHSSFEVTLEHFWWECVPLSVDEDEATSALPESRRESLTWLRNLRCVVPPLSSRCTTTTTTTTTSAENTNKGPAAAVEVDRNGSCCWSPGDYLTACDGSRGHDDDANMAALASPVTSGGFWALDRLPAGRVVLLWIPLGGGKDAVWMCNTVFRLTVVVPPVIHVKELLRSRARQSCGNNSSSNRSSSEKNEGDAYNDVSQQLCVMQCVLDAAQDVGYFFVVTRDDKDLDEEDPILLGNRCIVELQKAVDGARLSAIAREYSGRAAADCPVAVAAAFSERNTRSTQQHHVAAGSPLAAAVHHQHDNTSGSLTSNSAALPPLVAPQVCKYTIYSSTGSVKVSSNPLRYQQIVPPAWLTNEQVSLAVLPYYRGAKELAMVLMEALAQDSVSEDQLYLLLRAVVYPPSLPSPPSTSLSAAAVNDVHASPTTPGGEEAACIATVTTSLSSSAKSPSGQPTTTLDVHTDKSWITLLLATTFHGLMFQSSDGLSFDPVVAPCVDEILIIHQEDSSTSSFSQSPTTVLRMDEDVMAVNIGDAFQMSSRGAFLSRPHMAMYHPAKKNIVSVGEHCRVSLPLFVEPGVGFWPAPYESQEVVTIAL